MKKKIILPVLKSAFLLVILSIVVSCGGSHKPKVGFLFPNFLHDRYLKEKAIFTDRINELGGEAIVESANNDDNLQIQQGYDLIKKGCKVLVVNSVNLYKSAEIVRAAHAKGIKVIAYDRLICNSEPDYYLSFDNEKVGILMADYVIKKIPEGKYLIFAGDKMDLNAGFVKDGQFKSLDPVIKSEKVKINFNEFIEDWSGENAGHELKRYLDLTGEQPDVILSSYDGMSTGIIEVLKDFGMEGKVLVTGQDAELAACRNIVKGYQVMTVYKPIKKLALAAAELSMQLINSKDITNATSKVYNGSNQVPAILLDPITVDKENLKSTVIADGYLSEEEIFKP